jgi:hypothetical protein
MVCANCMLSLKCWICYGSYSDLPLVLFAFRPIWLLCSTLTWHFCLKEWHSEQSSPCLCMVFAFRAYWRMVCCLSFVLTCLILNLRYHTWIIRLASCWLAVMITENFLNFCLATCIPSFSQIQDVGNRCMYMLFHMQHVFIIQGGSINDTALELYCKWCQYQPLDRQIWWSEYLMLCAYYQRNLNPPHTHN